MGRHVDKLWRTSASGKVSVYATAACTVAHQPRLGRRNESSTLRDARSSARGLAARCCGLAASVRRRLAGGCTTILIVVVADVGAVHLHNGGLRYWAQHIAGAARFTVEGTRRRNRRWA